MNMSEFQGEITVSEQLRDKAKEHLPAAAFTAKQMVKVEYWPVESGETKVTITYNPDNEQLEIGTDEVIGRTFPDQFTTHNFIHSRGIELDGNTGEIQMYTEVADVRDNFGRLVDSDSEIIDASVPGALVGAIVSLSSEIDKAATVFDENKQGYLLNLLENI